MTKSLINLLKISVLILVAYFIFNLNQNQEAEAQVKNSKYLKEKEIEEIRNNITNYVIVSHNQYKYSTLGGIYDLEVNILNKTNYLLDNVKVNVNYIKANGDLWQSKVLDFNLVQPSSTIMIKVPDTDRGVEVNCEIISIKSNELGLN